MKSALKNYKNITHIAAVRRLLAADAISKTGDWFLYVAMSALVVKAGGAGMLAMFTAMRVVIPAALGPWAGRWGMMLPPRMVMIIADIARAGLLLLAAAAARTGQSVWLLEVLVAGSAAFTALHDPAERRFQRHVVAPEARGDFNAVIGATGTTVIVVAPAIGGLTAVAIGNVGALVVDAVSFLLSAAFVAAIRGTQAAPAPAQTVKAAGLRKGTIGTVAHVLKQDSAVLTCVMTQAVACTIAGASLVLIPLISGHLNAGQGTVGWLTTAIGAGSVAGMLLGGSVARKGRLVPCVASIVVMGVILGLLGSSPDLVAALACSALAGLAANLPDPMYWLSYANRVHEADSGPFYGLVDSAITGGFALGGVVFGALAATMGISAAAWALGIGCSALAATALIPAVRQHAAGQDEDKVTEGAPVPVSATAPGQ